MSQPGNKDSGLETGAQDEPSRPSAASKRQRDRDFEPFYRPEDDTYCWLCGGPVVKRHCKLICQVCGFMRDCSDP